MPLFGVEALEDSVSDSMGQQRFTMIVLGVGCAPRRVRVRDTLASFVLLRAAVAADQVMPGADLAANVAAARHPLRRWRVALDWRVPIAGAAMVAVLLAAGSFWAGASWPARVPGTPAAQTAALPGGAAPSSAPAVPGAPRPTDDDVPPTPTRVLRFAPGVDWHEGS
ncbi:MAG: hypothetical protein Q7V01_12355 [Vicinamibacterales bacterium]|nr:hypothetical protein [Vicinamibacterales bacterium]